MELPDCAQSEIGMIVVRVPIIVGFMVFIVGLIIFLEHRAHARLFREIETRRRSF